MLVTALFISCGGKKPSDYFVMKNGSKWEYNFQIAGSYAKMTTIVRGDTISPNGRKYIRFESVFEGVPGMGTTNDYYRETNDGIVIGSPDPNLPTEMIIIPAKLEIGNQWQIDVPPNGKRKYKIASFDDLEIDKMNFKNCLKIEYEESKETEHDAGYFYFAKNTGLVKFSIRGLKNDGTSSVTEASLSRFTQ